MDGALYGVSGTAIFGGLIWVGIKAYFNKQKNDSDKLHQLEKDNAVHDAVQDERLKEHDRRIDKLEKR